MEANVSRDLFGVVVPGRMPLFDFMPIDETKCVTEVEAPTSIPELTFFMLPSTPIPEGYGGVLYYSLPPFDNWELLGCVSPEKPSGVFRTGWTTNEDMIDCPVVQLGVSIEPLETIFNLDIAMSGVDDRHAFAHKIAQDLFQYMASFSQNSDRSMMTVPSTIFDKWMERFDRKYQIDPNFMMKSNI